VLRWICDGCISAEDGILPLQKRCRISDFEGHFGHGNRPLRSTAGPTLVVLRISDVRSGSFAPF
jgi:hypothetical protein